MRPQGGSVLPVPQYEGWGEYFCVCISLSGKIVLNSDDYSGKTPCVAVCTIQKVDYSKNTLRTLCYAGRYEIVLRVHGPSLRTQMDRIKLEAVKSCPVTCISVLLFVKEIFLSAAPQLFYFVPVVSNLHLLIFAKKNKCMMIDVNIVPVNIFCTVSSNSI